MKYAAITTIFVSSLAVAAAFTTGKPAFARLSVATNMSSAADFVNSEIAAHDVVVFSKSSCPFCKKTKALMEDLKVEATVYELNQMDNGADIQDALLALSGQRTVPNVFVKGEHIGGNQECQDAAKAGTLQTKLGL
jgi:glutaredoxin 3